MEKEQLPQQDIRQQYRLCAAVGLILLLLYLPQELLGDLWSRINSFDLFRMTVFISLTVSLRLFRGSLAELLLLLYALWFFFSRLLLGEPLGSVSLYHLVNSILFPACFLSLGYILSREERLRLLTLALSFAALFWLLLALLGLYATARLERVQIPFTSFTVGLDYVSMNNQMTVAHVNRNITAGWFSMGLFFSLWLFFRSKKRLLRLLWGAAVPVFYAAVSMSMSRTVGLSTALGLSLLLFLLLYPRLRARFPALFPLLAALVLLISLPLFYRGQSLVTRSFSVTAEKLWYARGMDKLQPAPTPTPSPTPQPEETPFVRPRKEAEHFFDDTRSDSNIRSIGSRSTLWYCGLQVLREDSRQLLLGDSMDSYMLPVNRYSQALLGIDHEQDYYHMHNFLYDALMLCGLPGFLLLAFTLLLSLRMLRVLLCPDPLLPLGLRLLTLPLIGQLLINMAEAFLLRGSLLCTLLFFLIAGVFLRWSEELLPRPTI